MWKSSLRSSIQEAAQQMRSLDVGVLPVFEGDRLVGMLTDRDLAVRATAEGKDPKTTTVQEAMTPDVAYCFEDQDIEEAGQIMKENQIRRLPILNRKKLLVGMSPLGIWPRNRMKSAQERRWKKSPNLLVERACNRFSVQKPRHGSQLSRKPVIWARPPRPNACELSYRLFVTGFPSTRRRSSQRNSTHGRARRLKIRHFPQSWERRAEIECWLRRMSQAPPERVGMGSAVIAKELFLSKITSCSWEMKELARGSDLGGLLVCCRGAPPQLSGNRTAYERTWRASLTWAAGLRSLPHHPKRHEAFLANAYKWNSHQLVFKTSCLGPAFEVLLTSTLMNPKEILPILKNRLGLDGGSSTFHPTGNGQSDTRQSFANIADEIL
jgi:predicted transcriptional regulator